MKKKSGPEIDFGSKLPLLAGLMVLILLLLVVVSMFMQILQSSLTNTQSGTNGTAPMDIFSQPPEDADSYTPASEFKGVEGCLSEKGFNSSVYLYSPTCPHCQRMMPVIDQLISEGYNISKASIQDSTNFASVAACVKIRSVVPQVICNKDGTVLEGESTIDEVKAFYENCYS